MNTMKNNIQNNNKIESTTVWSAHTDFDPEKRIQFRFSTRLLNQCLVKAEEFDDQLIELEELLSYNPKCRNAYILPANHLSVRFKGNNYYKIDPQDVSVMISSVRKQEMTEEEIIKFCLRVASVWTKQQRDIGFRETYGYYYAYAIRLMKKMMQRKNHKMQYTNVEWLNKIRGVTHIIPMKMSIPIKAYSSSRTLGDRLDGLKTALVDEIALLELIKQLELAQQKPTSKDFVQFYEMNLVLPTEEKMKLPKKTYTSACKVLQDEKIFFDNLTKNQQFVASLVDALIEGHDLFSAFKKLYREFSNIETSEEKIRILRIFSGFSEIDYYDNLLMKDYNKMARAIKDIGQRPDFRRDWRTFFNEDGYAVKKHLALKQKVALQWSMMLFKTPDFPLYYYNLDRMKEIVFSFDITHTMEHITKEELTESMSNRLVRELTEPTPGTSRSTEELISEQKSAREAKQQNVFKRIYGYFTGNLTNFLDKVEHTVDAHGNTVNNVNGLVNRVTHAFEEFKTKIENHEMGSYASCFSSAGTFKKGFMAIQLCMDMMFNKVMSSITDLFGVSYPKMSEVSFTRLVAVYLLWINTDSKVIKTFIMLQLATEFGIIDGAIDILKKLISKFRTLEEDDTTESANFRDFINAKKVNIKKRTEKLAETEKTEKTETSEDPLTWCDKIFNLLEVGKPAILGTLALTLIGVTVAKCTMKPADVGTKILNISKNISLTALGIAAVPRIFTNLVAVFKFVMDYLKGVFCKDHKTIIQKRKYVEDFLKATSGYEKATSPILFARNPIQCFQFINDFQKIKTVREYTTELRDTFLATEVRRVVKEMSELVTTAISAMKMYTSGQEPIHFQFYSKTPGVGKTDLNNLLLPVLKAKMIELEKAEGFGRTYSEHTMNDVAYLSDTTSYADTYYYQRLAVIDDMNIFSTNQEESVTNKMLLLSGNPCVVNKASLEDKGMLYNIKVLVTNTNNAFPNIEGMMCKNALYRRRQLFEVKVKEHLQLEENGQKCGRIDEQKLLELGISRTRCEHLEIHWKQAHWDEQHDLAGDPVPHPDCPAPMSVENFFELVEVLYEEHYRIEQERAMVRNPVAYQIGKYFSNSLDALYQTWIVADPKMEKEIQSMVIKAKETVTDANAEELRKLKIFEKAKIAIRRMFFDLVAKSELSVPEDPSIKDMILILRNHQDATKSESSHYFQTLKVLRLIGAYETVYEWLDLQPYAEELSRLGIQDLENENIPDVENTGDYMKYGYMVEDGNLCLTYSTQGMKHDNADFSCLDLSKLQFVNNKHGNVPYFEGVGDQSINFKAMASYLNFLVVTHENNELPLVIWKEKKKNKIHVALAQAKREELLKKQTMLQKITNAGKWIIDKVFKIFGTLLKGLLILGATVMGFFAIKEIAKVMAGPQDTMKYDGALKNLRFGGRFLSKDAVNTACFANVQDDYINDLKHVQKSTYKMMIFHSDKQTIMGTVTAFSLGGSIFGTVKHAFKHCTEDEIIVGIFDPIREQDPDFENVTYVTSILRSKHISEHPTLDFAMVDMRGFRATKDMTPHFVTEKDLEDKMLNFTRFFATTITLRPKATVGPKTLGQIKGSFKYGNTGFCQAEPTNYFSDGGDKENRMVEIIGESPAEQTILGDSGALLFHDNSKMGSRYLLGVSCSRSERMSYSYYACVITQEIINKMKRKFNFESRVESSYFETTSLPEDHRLQKVYGVKEYLRKSPFRTLDVSGTSGFAKTPIYELFPVESQPAIQRENDPRQPEGVRHFLQVSLNKYNGDQNTILSQQDRDEMTRFQDMIYDEYFSQFLHTVRIYNSREAITGIRMKGSTPINYHTSAGLPYSLENNTKGKAPYIKYDEEQNAIYVQDIVYHHVDYYKRAYIDGRLPENFKSEYRKKELVGEKKILNPKTRTIGTGNMIHQIIYNEMFKDLYTKMKNVWNEGATCPYALGIDMEKHANSIVEHIKWTDCVYDFDVEAWERSVNLDLCLLVALNRARRVKKSYEQRGEKCPLEVEKLAAGITVDFMDSEYIFADVLNHKTSGLLSGHPGTFVENSEIHMLLIHKVILHILRKKGRNPTLKYILNNIRVLVAADDILVALSPAIRDLITSQDLKDGYKSFGFKITSADKTDNIVRKDIYSCQFLKHTFRKELVEGYDAGFVAQPMESIINQLFNWISTESKLKPKEQFKTNVENAFRFAFWRGQQYYEDTRAKFNSHPHSGIKWHYNYEEMRQVIGQQHLWEQYVNKRMDYSQEDADFDDIRVVQ